MLSRTLRFTRVAFVRLLPIVGIGMFVSTMSLAAAAADLTIIPTPQKIKHQTGVLTLTPQSQIVVAEFQLIPLAKLIAEEIQQLTSLRLKTAVAAPRAGDIALKVNPAIRGEEHTIDVGDTATVEAGNTNAIVFGTATLLQSMTKNADGVTIPQMVVRDKPAVEYRGLMLDCARNWHSIKTLKQMVVLCRWYKIRYLHLHLNDDQSFTFPSKAFPKLATRGRHYSLVELRDLEAYASLRGVTIVPELETPGHATAMTTAMPELFMPGSKQPQAICVGREKVYAALDTLVGEMCSVFRSTPYFHIGGDEVNYAAWNNCKETKEYMAAKNLDNPMELYRHFLVRMNEIVKRHGKKTIVWEGFHKDGKTQIPRDIVVMAFECKYNLPPDLIADGYQVINTAWQPLYVTNSKAWSPEAIYKWNVHRWENWWDQSKAFPNGIDVAPTPLVLGAQMCAWEQPESAELPSVRERLASMSERTWNPAAGRAYADFAGRLRATDAKLSRLLP